MKIKFLTNPFEEILIDSPRISQLEAKELMDRKFVRINDRNSKRIEELIYMAKELLIERLESRCWNDDVLIDKINELVDRVNQYNNKQSGE